MYAVLNNLQICIKPKRANSKVYKEHICKGKKIIDMTKGAVVFNTLNGSDKLSDIEQVTSNM